MTDPERYRTNGSDLERCLFASLEDDAPPAAARARMLAALGAAAALSATESAAAATGASKGAHGLGWLLIAKWMAAGAATALVTVGTGVAVSTAWRSPPAQVTTVRAHSAATASPRSAPTAHVPTPHPSRDDADRAERETAAEARPGAGTPTTGRLRSGAPALEKEAPRAGAAVTNVPPPPSDLAREVALLDDVQKTLDHGDPRGALRRLDLYTASFPAPSLGPEATLLRVRALLVSGDRAGAEGLGLAFVARNPHSQHAERIQSLLAPAALPAGRFVDQTSRTGAQGQ